MTGKTMNLKDSVITLTPAQNGGWAVVATNPQSGFARSAGAFTSTEEMIWHLAAALCPNMDLFGDAAPQGVRVP